MKQNYQNSDLNTIWTKELLLMSTHDSASSEQPLLPQMHEYRDVKMHNNKSRYVLITKKIMKRLL